MTGFRRSLEYRDSGVNQERDDTDSFEDLAGGLPVDPGRFQDRGGDPVAEEPPNQHLQSTGQDVAAASNQELWEKACLDAVEAGHWTAAYEIARPLPSNAMSAQRVAWLKWRLLSRRIAKARERQERGADSFLKVSPGNDSERTA